MTCEYVFCSVFRLILITEVTPTTVLSCCSLFHRSRAVLFCCPLQGGSKLQPTHEPVHPNTPPVELKPQTFLSWPWSGPAVGIICWRVCTCRKYWVLRGIGSCLAWGCSFGAKLKRLRGRLTCRTEDLPDWPDAVQRRALFCPLVAYSWITPFATGEKKKISVGTVELDELTEVYKTNKLKHDNTQTRSYKSQIPFCRVCRHTTLTPKSSS